MTTPSDEGRLRIADVDRVFVTEQLQAAVGAGMLSLDEFAERADAVHSAKTRSELALAVSDLPGLRLSAADAHPERARVSTVMSKVERTGRWVVPRLLEVRCTMGTIKIDLVDADIDNNHAVVDVRNHMGTVVVIVPQGTVIDSSGVGNHLGTIKSRVRGGKSSGLTVTVRGSVTMGTLKFRPPLPEMIRGLGF